MLLAALFNGTESWVIVDDPKTLPQLPVSPAPKAWSFGSDYEEINKRMIELRYQLLPYIYNVMHQASETGIPAMRPVFMEFPDEEEAAATEDEFLFGHDLLAAPVLYQGQIGRDVYLPKCEWYDYWTGKLYHGGQTIHVPAAISSLPLFVRAGAFIYQQPVVQCTAEMAGKPLRILVAPAPSSTSTLYEDDGETIAYRSGNSVTRTLVQTDTPKAMEIKISNPDGPYRPAARDLSIETWMAEAPQTISILSAGNSAATNALPRVDGDKMASCPSCWSFANAVLTIKTPDHFDSERFIISK